MSQRQAATVEHIDGECVVTLHGDIDIANAEEVLTSATDAINTCPTDSTRIIMDLAAVTFIDSTGIGALVNVRNASRERGIPTLLRNVPLGVERVLTISGLTPLFATTLDTEDE